jgi:hypothetical protein
MLDLKYNIYFWGLSKGVNPKEEAKNIPFAPNHLFCTTYKSNKVVVTYVFRNN